jgi:hypothetical protein
MTIRTKEISIGRVDFMRMGTTYIFEFQKKKINVVVVATETINVARGTCSSLLKKIRNGMFKLHFQKRYLGLKLCTLIEPNNVYILIYL